MKRWTWVFATVSALAFVGCGGSGGGGTVGGGGGGTGTGRSVASVNLPDTPGLVQIGFSTGQGRAVGDTYAVMRRFSLTDNIGTAEDRLSSTRKLLLKGYEFQLMPVNVPLGTAPSRTFNNYTLDILRVEQDNGGGSTTSYDFASGVPAGFPSRFAPIPATIPSRITAFTGRTTTVPVFLDDAMLYLYNDPSDDPDAGDVMSFDKDQFNAINLPVDDPRLLGFLSDYVRFDISNMAPELRPTLLGGTAAGSVLFSGDGYAISESGSQGVYNALTLDQFTPVEGRFKGPTVIGGQATPGTYTLIQSNPSDLAGLSRITSLQGTWREATDLIANLGNFEVITFPNSAENGRQDMIAIVRTAGVITNFYFGEADLNNGNFRLYPIGNIVGASTTGELTGTITEFKDKNGAAVDLPNRVREGSYTFNGAVPTGFSTTGRFIVFRR
ncbi:MAG: hypothetical protein ACOYON_08125 [Fimbriimonas sp.]